SEVVYCDIPTVNGLLHTRLLKIVIITLVINLLLIDISNFGLI
ncbi:unnamed protein product, partial [Rotaria sp. Silwood1]